MNRELCREQEEKCAAAYKFHVEELGLDHYHIQEYLDAWKDCLAANAIGESVAPQWVIDMIRTGKPVRCEVANDEEEWERQCYVTGYDIKAVDAFSDEYGTTWKYARPIPEWKPKDGEAVLTRVFDKAEVGAFKDGHICVRDMKHRIEEVGMDAIKPFNYSHIGKPWSVV